VKLRESYSVAFILHSSKRIHKVLPQNIPLLSSLSDLNLSFTSIQWMPIVGGSIRVKLPLGEEEDPEQEAPEA
jgi:hypothetical protein